MTIKYFSRPILGTQYVRYYHLEGNSTVVAIDISRPDGMEVPHPAGVKFKVRLSNHKRHSRFYDAADAARAEYVDSVRRSVAAVKATKARKANAARNKSTAALTGWETGMLREQTAVGEVDQSGALTATAS